MPDIQYAAIEPLGNQVAFQSENLNRIQLRDVDTGELRGYFEAQDRFPSGSGTVFSPDGMTVVALTRSREVVLDALTGWLHTRLGSTGTTYSASFSPRGTTLVTADVGELLVWTLDERLVATGGAPAVHINPDAIVDGPIAAVYVYAPALHGTPPELVCCPALMHVIDEFDGDVVDSIYAANVAQLPDGRFVFASQNPTDATVDLTGSPWDGSIDFLLGGISIWEPSSGTVTEVTQCAVLLSEAHFVFGGLEGGTSRCADGEPVFAPTEYQTALLVASDGSMIAASSDRLDDIAPDGTPRRAVRVWDAVSLDEVTTIYVGQNAALSAVSEIWLIVKDYETNIATVHSIADGSVIAEIGHGSFRNEAGDLGGVYSTIGKLTADGRHLLTTADRTRDPDGGELVLLSTEDWSEVARWRAADGVLRGFMLSPDGQRLATSGEDGVVRVWDFAGLLAGESDGGPRSLLEEIPTGVVSDIRWISETRLGLALRSGVWRTLFLDPDEFVSDVASRLLRTFTKVECQTYRIEPCPTLRELRAG